MPGVSERCRAALKGFVAAGVLLYWGLPLNCTNIPACSVDAACGSEYYSESSRRSRYVFAPTTFCPAHFSLVLGCGKGPLALSQNSIPRPRAPVSGCSVRWDLLRPEIVTRLLR